MALRNRYATAALVAALALALVALAGCGDTTNVTSAAAANTVTASGAGTTQAAPDTAEMSFGVTTLSRNAKTALDNHQERRADRLRGQEAGRRRRGHPDAGRQRLPADRRPGRQAGHHRLPGVAERERQGARHRQARRGHHGRERAGANTINGPSFTVADPAPARAEAIDEAVADARKSAEAMAEAAGKSVGDVLSMSSSDVGMVAEAMYSGPTWPGRPRPCPSSRVSSTSARAWSWSSSSSSLAGHPRALDLTTAG